MPENKRSLLKTLLFPGGILASFAAAAAVALAVQGRLNSRAFDAFRAAPPAPADKLGLLTPREPEKTTPLRQLRIAELDQLVHEGKKTQKLLEQRAAELDRQEERIKAYRKEIEGEKQLLDGIRAGLDRREAELKEREDALTTKIVEIDQAEAVSLKKYAAIYAAMEPASAAASLDVLDPLDAAKILFYMQEKKSAKVLEEIKNPARGAELLKHFKTLRDKTQDTTSGGQP